MLWFAIACQMGLCTDRRPPPTSEPYMIVGDRGGQLISAEADREMLLKWGGRIEIRGKCFSACVIFTTLPNACLGPASKIGFHGSNVNAGQIGSAQMARYLRGAIKERYLSAWQFVPTDQIHIISGTAYAQLDPQVKLCTPYRRN